jgi:hypothetical protein
MPKNRTEQQVGDTRPEQFIEVAESVVTRDQPFAHRDGSWGTRSATNMRRAGSATVSYRRRGARHDRLF